MCGATALGGTLIVPATQISYVNGFNHSLFNNTKSNAKVIHGELYGMMFITVTWK
jgi:hypothetical protein